MRVYTIAEVPDQLVQKWLQHLRDFDSQNPGCHFNVAADAPNLSVTEMMELIKVNPELTFQKLFERPNFNQDDD